MKIAVIGCGRISGAHFRAIGDLRDNVELTAVVDVDAERAKTAAKKYGAKRYYAETKELWKDNEVEAVDICLPMSLHAPVAVEAAQAKKHIMVEKPMALTVNECDRMIAVADKNDVQLMVGQSRRFNGPLMKAKEIIDSGKIGQLLHISYRIGSKMEEAATYWWNIPEVTGKSNLLYNWSSHIIDQIIWIAGRKPVRVYAEGLSKNPVIYGIDEFSAVLGFDNELIASYQHSYNNNLSNNITVYLGTKGIISMPSAGVDLLLNGEKIELKDRNVNNFTAQLKEFVSSVEENREPLTSGRKIRPVIEVIEAIIESIEKHKLIKLV